MSKIAIYVHWPFCLSKCPYCDFNSHIANKIDVSEWKNAYLKEIEYFRDKISGRYISSIFFGGGTPSLMDPYLLESLITKLASFGKIDNYTEITLEANPTSSESQKFKDFKACGVNRISIGVQSLRTNDLKFLGREHNVLEAISAINLAQETFERSSFDLIYARPGQSMKDWKEELQEVLKLASSHISLYQLTIEKGTLFYKQYKNKDFILPENDLAADMYDWTDEYLASNGFSCYEISNYAKEGEECRHNLTYWNYGEYIGIGPGAHSRLQYEDGYFALMNIHNPEKWLSTTLSKGFGIQTKQALSNEEIRDEIIMMGLRLANGIDDLRLYELTSKKFADALNMKEVQKYIESGFLEFKNNILRLTKKGIPLHNNICSRI